MPDSPAEALDRITVPPEAMTRIAEALTTGGSIIVSDQGINAGETGEGTDFIPVVALVWRPVVPAAKTPPAWTRPLKPHFVPTRSTGCPFSAGA